MEQEIIELQQKRQDMIDNMPFMATASIQDVEKFMSRLNTLGIKIEAKRANMKFHRSQTAMYY